MAGKFCTTSVFFLVVIENLCLCNSNGFHGCECNIMDACDMQGHPRSNWDQYVPAGLEQFGYVQKVQKLEYMCEDGTVAILYDSNSQIPLYAATRMTGDQLSAGSIGRPFKRFRESCDVPREYQQENADYKRSSQRQLCFRSKVQKTLVVDTTWVSAKFHKSAVKPSSVNVCLPGTDFLQTEIHRGHLIASQYGRGNKEKMFATFTYTNVVPQFGRFNSGPWQQCESSLVMWGRNNCAINGAQSVQVFIVVGAIPSTVFGSSETRFFGEEGFSDYKDETDYPVNVPKYLWTAACCTFEYNDSQGKLQIGTKSTAFQRENDPGDSPCNKMNIPSLTTFLSGKTIQGNINLFPQSPQCYNPNNYILLKC